MAYVASAVADDRVQQPDQIEWFGRFRAYLRATQTRLSPDDQRKLDDFGRDLESMRRLSEDANGTRDTALGRFHARFERIFDRRRGGAAHHRGSDRSALHSIAQPIPALGRAHDAAHPITARESAMHAAHDATSTLEPFENEYRLLDRLSLRYGGLYRGIILFNYTLAIIAGFLAILEQVAEHWLVPEGAPATVRSEASSFAHWLLTSGKGFAVTFAGLEVLLIVVGALFFLRGYTPSPGHKPPKWLRGWCAHRWHERWIEYRLLAERFRYAMLLEPFAGPTAVAWRGVIVNPGETPGWPDRYFLWRIENGEPNGGDRKQWWQWLIATIEAQSDYHGRAAERRESIAHLLHRIASLAFVIGITLLVVRFAGLLYEWIVHVEPESDALFVFALLIAVVGGIGAAAHGISGTLELTKIATRSRALAARMDALRVALLAKVHEEPSIEVLRPEVEAFCRLVTEEASGWQAVYRDKNIPLPHA